MAMKLMTVEIAKALNKATALMEAHEADLVSVVSTPEDYDSRPVVVKYFTPDAQCTWFILDGAREGNTWRLFGLCDLGMGCPELGYVMLDDLEKVRGGLGLPVERDLGYSGTLRDARRQVVHA